MASVGSKSPEPSLEIYKPVSILHNFPLDIECIYAYDNYLMMGTRDGTLLLYKLQLSYTPEPKFEVDLIKSKKGFSRKPILQIAAIPELRLLLCLSDGLITVHSLTESLECQQTQAFEQAKGTLQFVVDLRRVQTITNESRYTLRLCILLKRRLLFYYWKNDRFQPLCSEFSTAEISLPDTPRTLAWCKDSLCLGYRNEYSLVKIGDRTRKLFSVGLKYPEPFVACLAQNRLVLGKDENTYFFDEDGQPTLKYPLNWSGCLTRIADDLIYLVGLLNNGVEIKTIEPKVNLQLLGDLQRMSKNRFRHLIRCANRNGYLFLCSQSDVVALVSVDYQRQLTQLIDAGQFELALKLAELYLTPEYIGRQKEAVNRQQIENIKYLQAFDYFCKKQFSRSIQLYTQLEVDPSVVIGLYPDLLPEEFRSKICYPNHVPDLAGSELEEAISVLQNYLVEIRHRLHKKENQQQASSENSSGFVGAGGNAFAPEINQKKLKQIVDTTLLKCYLQNNDALVSSLLRLPTNYCHLEEAEKVLKRYHKYSELMILYKSRNLHRKALQLLERQAKKTDSYVSEPHIRTKEYLQHLGSDNLELIFEYAEWVLKEHPEEGLKIFTEDIPETESLPRSIVLEYLERINPSFAIPYLEHIIYEWNDTDHLLHDTLANKYREKIRLLMEARKAEADDESIAECLKAGQEPGELGELRQKLIRFLYFSFYYTAEKLAHFFLYDGLWEERAIVLSKLGNHKEALAIYVFVLKDNEKAEQYCEKVYEKDKPGSRDVFLLLLRLYLIPAEASTLMKPGEFSSGLLPPDMSPASVIHNKIATSNTTSSTTTTPQNLELVLQLINKYPLKIDPIAVLNELSGTIPVSALRKFLITIVRHLISEKHQAQIHRSLLLTQHLCIQTQRILAYNEIKVVIDEYTQCSHCKRKIGKSAFLRYPNTDLIHYSCKDSYEESQTK